jgi:Rrf2 family protein
MKISTRVRYGLRFMLELAAHYQKGPIFLKDIARVQDISEKYLSQIAIDLKQAHLIDGFRGVHGGYVLTKAPSKVSVYDIVAVFEGDLAMVECARDPSLCGKASHCIAHEVWHKLSMVMTETLEAMTLSDLLERQKEKMQEAGMYHI